MNPTHTQLPTGSIPIASGSAQPLPVSSKISTSVQMSDGTCLPLSFRNSTFSRFPFTPHSPLHSGPASVHMASPPEPHDLRLATSPAPGLSFCLGTGFSLSPAAGFHPASFTGPGSFGAAHLARMESAFCQNFVCCALPLRDLHDLLEHFEQAHCHAGDIVGVDGFEGVTLDQMAAGVGLSAELGLGPGSAPAISTSESNRRRRARPSLSNGSRLAPPNTLHELQFEDEEEWSSGHDTSRSVSPAQLTGSIHPHSSHPLGSEIEEDTMTRLGKTLRETLGSIRPTGANPDRERSRTGHDWSRTSSSRSRSPSVSLSRSDSQDGRNPAGSDRALSELIATFRSKARGSRHETQDSHRSGFSRDDLNASVYGRIGRMEGGAIDPAVLLKGHSFEDVDQNFEEDCTEDSFSHLQLDPQQLLQHQQQQRRRRRPNLDPITGLTPTGRLPRPWTPASEKPFKCSVPGCEKAYKQQNGLKYHKAHGHSSQAILTADEESKAFVCHDSVCGKRYKNMNGLRYHYQHTGPHGALGIQLLSLGVHPPPQYPAGHKKASLTPSFSPALALTPAPSSSSSPPSFG